MTKSKMYILVKIGIPLGYQVNSVAHAVLQCYLKFQGHPDMQSWLKESFKKVTCLVTPEEFEIAKKYDDYVICAEQDMGEAEIVIAFRPRAEWSERFKTYRLFGAGHGTTT